MDHRGISPPGTERVNIMTAKMNETSKFDFTAAAAEVRKIIAASAGLRTKAHENEKKAAVILIAAKAACKHGQYGKWLDSVDIARTTAARIVREYNNPEKKAERQKANKATPSAKSAKVVAAGDPKDTLRVEVLRIVGGLDADQIAAVYGFLAAQGMTDDDASDVLTADAAAAAG